MRKTTTTTTTTLVFFEEPAEGEAEPALVTPGVTYTAVVVHTTLRIKRSTQLVSTYGEGVSQKVMKYKYFVLVRIICLDKLIMPGMYVFAKTGTNVGCVPNILAHFSSPLRTRTFFVTQ